jgi:Tol biopolymer transport system component
MRRFVLAIIVILLATFLGLYIWAWNMTSPKPSPSPRQTVKEGSNLEATGDGSYAPAWSPDGASLAFVIFENTSPSLVIKDLKGNTIDVLIREALSLDDLTWSPAGAEIAFAGKFSVSEAVQIYTVRTDGTGLTKLTTEPRGARKPQWLPDGRSIVYIRHPLTDNRTLRKVDIASLLTTDIGDAPDQDYAISPDGSAAALIEPEGIRIVSLEGELESHIRLSVGLPHQIAWSPDGRWIAFVAYEFGYGELMLVRSDGGEILRLTDREFEDGRPVWSPDSQTIAFRRSADDSQAADGDIYLIDITGDHLRRLAMTPFDETFAVWSPTGERLALEVLDPMLPFQEIYLVNLDGTEIIRLRDDAPIP